MKTRLTAFHTKPRKPLSHHSHTSLKSSPFPSLKRNKPIRVAGKSDTATVKQEIQDVVREIVILRDGGCIARDQEWHESCGGYTKDGKLVLQADHLIERSNSATYAEPRLIVCVCKGLHGWKHFKKSNHDLYNQRMKELLPESRVRLWEQCEKDFWKPHRTSTMDWKLMLVALKQDLAKMQLSTPQP